MEETEKMTALKKAYAEIILNTAKEAAARIIVSERRAQLCQRDLSETKEEALRIMLRVKQMIDLKVNEDQTKSLIQRKRIDELEAQLHEAEDLVGNLRANLYETQAQLEKVSKNQQQPVDSLSHPTEENTQQSLRTEWKNSVSSENGHASSCHIEDSGKTDIMPRSIKPGLYRNGYTQRIQACDRKLSNGHLSLCEDPDDHKSGKLYDAHNGEENEGKAPVNSTETIQDNNKAHLRLKRKRAMRKKRNKFGQEALATGLERRLAMTIPSKPPAAVTDETHDASVAVTDNDLEVADALILITQESVSKTEIGVTGSEEEKENPTSSPEKSNAQVSDLSDVVSIQSPKSRIVKYTFQRKRKRESSQSISIDNSNSSPPKENPIQITGKEQDDQPNTVMPESSHDSQQMPDLTCQRPS